MSTDKEAQRDRQDEPDYERPAMIIDPSHLSEKSDSKELQQDSADKSRPLFQRFKEWSREHATPMNLLTLVIAVAAWAQFHATQGQLGVMRGQLDEMRDERTIQNRPWLKTSIKLKNPMKFDVAESGSGPIATLTVENTVENVGASVAVTVYGWIELLPSQHILDKFVVAEQSKLCDPHRYLRRRGMEYSGQVVFPHDSLAMEETIKLPMDEMRAATNPRLPSYYSPEKKGRFAIIDGTTTVALFGCVAYRAPFESEDMPTHQTRFMYQLLKGYGENNGLSDSLFVPEGIVPLRLAFTSTGFTADQQQHRQQRNRDQPVTPEPA